MEESKKSVTAIIVSVLAFIFFGGLLVIAWNVAQGLFAEGSLEIVALKNTNLEESLLFYLFLVGIVADVFFSLFLFLN